MSTLADRVRDVLKTPGAKRADAPGPIGPGLHPTATLESALGGAWRGDASCFVVESRREPASCHGRERVGTLAEELSDAAEELLLLAGLPARPPLLFFDLETTGLSGGAGTYAFLVGCGWFDEAGAFVTRQYMLVGPAQEPAMLSSLAGELSRAGALVSFNGRSFDAPLIETRYLYHRLPWTGASLPHVDMLHIARRFWKRGEGVEAMAQESGCSLVALERHLLGHRRQDDVPGVEIPQRYFQFVRSGDAGPLAPVFEHNRLDLLSLAALTARVVRLVRAGPGGANDAREALAIGAMYTRAGLGARALEAYERAVELSSEVRRPSVLTESLRALAFAYRRSRQHDEAARCWRRILGVRGCSRQTALEANEALAIHHEHRLRDLACARTFALQSLEEGGSTAKHLAVRHRLARIDRKLENLKCDVGSMNFEG